LDRKKQGDWEDKILKRHNSMGDLMRFNVLMGIWCGYDAEKTRFMMMETCFPRTFWGKNKPRVFGIYLEHAMGYIYIMITVYNWN
jgi:hypothetical protein